MRKFYALILLLLYFAFCSGTAWADMYVRTSIAAQTDSSNEERQNAPDDSELHTVRFIASAKQLATAFKLNPLRCTVRASAATSYEGIANARLGLPTDHAVSPRGPSVLLHVRHCVFRI